MMQSRGSAPRQLPWADWEEWDSVRRGLFDSAAGHKSWAVGVVSMWRRRGRVPHAVESTAQLVEIGLGDPQSNLCGGRADNELRLSYSLAVVRAVNGLVDPQQQNYFAGSVLALAGKMGIPGWIVELRHDATHSDMPSLSVLRNAAFTLLAWYEQHYWRKQAEHLRSLSASIAQESPTDDMHGGGQRSDKKVLTLSSFSDIVIPQLISDIVFFELDYPKDCSLFDLCRQAENGPKIVTMIESGDGREWCTWFKESQWKAAVDGILQPQTSPDWSTDCIVGNATSRIFSLLKEIQSQTDNEESHDVLPLLEWKIFVLSALIIYVLKALQRPQHPLPFSSAILAFNRSAQSHLLLPMRHILNIYISNCSLHSKRKKRQRQTDEDGKHEVGIFKPVIWPLGSVPGVLQASLYEIEECFEEISAPLGCDEILPSSL